MPKGVNMGEITSGRKCKKLTIETDGTSNGTFIKIDDRTVDKEIIEGRIECISLFAHVNKEKIDVIIMRHDDQLNRLLPFELEFLPPKKFASGEINFQ